MERTLLLLLALAVGIIAGPIQEVSIRDQCAQTCTVSNKFNYEAGTTYEFTYETDVRTAIQGASEDHAGVHLTSTVYLDFVSQCEMVLRMSDVRLTEHDPETSTMRPVTPFLISDLESNPLTVSYQDGNIEQLCLTNPESDKTLNIKRGVLSLIQNNMDDINAPQTVKEADVAGECQTEYTSEDKGWYNKLIKKSKNLLGCINRQSSNSALQGIPYTSNSDVQGLPLIKSSQDCEQEISKETGRLQVTSCHEKHVFVPFSRQDSGATTHNTQTLTYVKEFKSRAKQMTSNIRAPLTFQHSNGASADDNRKDVERKLVDICDNTMNGVTPDTPKMFSALVNSMKAISSKDMDSINKKIQSQTICPSNNKRVQKFFLDAVPMVGSTESVSYMADLIVSGQVAGLEADMWMTTLSFIQKPTIDMLKAVKALLTVDTLIEKSMLPVSSLVNTICRHNPECGNYVEVQKIISLLQSKIDPACKITNENFRQSLLAIRAIGNAGFGNSAMSTLIKCVRKTDNPIEIRLSAVDAFRRIPCNADKSDVLAVFADMEEESEVRIAAYKALMECASDDLIKRVKVVLSKETVNQVGSYVWTHLTNLMETSDPHKQTIRSILEDETLKQEFNMDSRKFSRNIEKSLFIEKINTGATVEGDMIWSSKSFMPRSGMLNLTIDLFGSAFNLFEIGGRVEGLEYFFEQYFGPNGYFSDNDVQAAVEETGVDVIKHDKIKRIDKRMNTVMDDLRGSFYLRVFGNEIQYMNFRGIDSLLSQNSINFLDILMKLAEDNDYQFTQSVMFMDSSIIIPTSSGFPLNLTINGTATVDLKASGKMEVMKLASSPPTLDVKGVIKPSAAVVVSTIMGIDALSTQVGVKMISTLYTGTAVQGRISLAEGTILNAEFDLPEEKMDIIKVKSEFFTVHQEQERAQKMITDDRRDHVICSGHTVSQITGLEVCAELSFTNASLVENAPYFPITGPMDAGITIYKRDNAMTGYKFEARSTHTNLENVIRVAFSTPNSKVDRSFGIDFNLNKADGLFDTSITSPWKKGSFKGAMVNTRLQKSITGTMNWDNVVKFDIQGDLKAERSGPGMIYTPSFTINVPKTVKADLSGSVQYNSWKLFTADLVLKGLTDKPVVIKSNIAHKAKVALAKASVSMGAKNVYSFDSSIQTTEYKKKIIYKPKLSIRTPTKELIAFGGTYTNVYGRNVMLDFVLDKVVSKPVMIKSNFITKAYRRGRVMNILRLDFSSSAMSLKTKSRLDNRNWKTIGVDVEFTYVIPKFARDVLKVASKVIDLSNKKAVNRKLVMTVDSNKNPDYNFKVMSEVNHNMKTSSAGMTFNYGTNFKNKDKQITFTSLVTRNIKSWTFASLSVNSKLEIGTGTRVVGKIDHTHRIRSLNNTMMFRLNKAALETTLELADNSKAQQTNLFGNLVVNLPSGKKFSLTQTVAEDQTGEFTSTINGGFGKVINTVVTSWKKSPSSLKFASNIALNKYEPVSFSAEYENAQNNHKTIASFSNGQSKYNIMLSSKSDVGSFQSSADVVWPSRRVVGNFEGTKVGNKYTSRAELRWDADRDDEKRISLFTSGQMESLKNMEGSISLQYPSRTIRVNMKQHITSKYTSHIDFSFEPKKTFAIDTTLGSYIKDDSTEIIGNFKLATPYTGLEDVEMTIVQQINDNSFVTKVDASWEKKSSVSGTFTLKRPLSLSNINAEMVAKAASLGIKSMQVSLNHKMNNGLRSSAEMNWNKQYFQIDVTVANSSDESKTDMRGVVDIKSSFGSMKTMSLTAEHTNNGRKVDTNAIFQYNKKSYGLTSTVRGAVRGWNLNTNGDISLSLPSNKIALNWNHKNTLSEITSITTFDLNGKSYQMNLNGLQDISLPKASMTISSELKSGSNSVGIQINHNHDSNQVDSSMILLTDGTTMFQSQIKYLNEKGIVTSKLSMTNPVYSGSDLTITFVADATKKPATATLEASISPEQNIILSGTLLFDSLNKLDLEATADVILPNTPVIKIEFTQKEKGEDVAATVSVLYDTDKEIRLETVRSNNVKKELQVKFVSPYTQDYLAGAMVSFKRNRFETASNIEVQPYVGKWSMNGLIDYSDSISGNLRVDTPYSNMSYSQISFGSSMFNGERKTTVNIEYIPGNKISMQTSHNIKSITDFAVSTEVSTPFEMLTYGKAVFHFNADRTQMNQYAEIEYPAGEKSTIESKISTKSGLTGSVSMASPYTHPLSVVFGYEALSQGFQSHVDVSYTMNVRVELIHEGTMPAFTTSGKLVINEDTFAGTVSFKLNPNVFTLLSVETPFQSVQFSNKFDGSAGKFTNDMSVDVSRYGKYSASVNVDILSTIDVSGTVQTPIKGFRNLKAAFKHDGSMASFQTHAELQAGSQLYTGDITFDKDPSLTFDATFKTPYTPAKILRLSMKVDGSLRNFQMHGEVQRNKELSELDLKASTEKKWNIDLAIRSPYIDSIKVSLDQWGKLSKFQTKLTASFGSQKIRSNAKFQMKPSVNALFSIRSPFSWIKNHQLSIKHSGDSGSFKCNSKLVLNGKTYTGDLTFQNLKTLSGNLVVKGATFKPIKASISHEGRPENFKTATSMSVGQDAIEGNLNVNTVNGIKGNLEVKTPFTGYNNIKGSVSHTGDITKFDSHAEVAVNKRQGQMDMSFDSTKDLAASVSLETPFSSWKSVSSSFRHSGNAESFSTSAQMAKNKQSIEGQMSFNNGKVVTGSASLKSTVPAIDNYEASFAHEGDMSKFSTNAEIISGKARHAANVDFSSQNGYEGSLKFDSPFMRNTALKFKHSLTDSSLSSDASIDYDGMKKYGLNANMATQPTMNGLIKVTTPHEGYESTELSLHHDSDASGFRSSGAFDLFGEKYEVEAGYSPVPDMTVFLTLKSPMFSDIKSTMSWEGRVTRFSSSYELTYGKQSQLRIESDLNLEGPIAGDLKVLSPHMKNMKASFSHTGDMSLFNSEAQVIFAGKKWNTDVTVQMTPSIKATVSMACPYSGELQVSFANTGSITRSQTSASMTYDSKSLWNIESSLNIDNDFKATLTLTTAMKEFEIAELKMSKEGDMTDMAGHFEATLNDAQVSTDLTFATDKASVSINAPFMDTLFGSFAMNNANLLLADVTSKVTYGDLTIYDVTSRMSIPQSAEVTVLLPAEGFESTTFTYKRSADIGGHFTLDVNGVRHEADAYMNTGRKLTAFLALDSPMLTPMSATFDYKQNSAAMFISGKMVYGNKNTEVDIEYKTNPSISGTVSVKLPNMEPMELAATFEGKPTNFKSLAKASYGSNINEVSGSLNIDDAIQAQLGVKSPMIVPFDISYIHTGTSTDFTCKAVVTVDSKLHTIDASYKSDNGIETVFNMQSPTFGSTNGLLRIEGEPTDFEVDLDFGRNSLKSSFKGSLKLQDEIKGSFDVVSPYSNANGALGFSGSLKNFQSDVEVVVDGNSNSGKINFNVETAHFVEVEVNMAKMSPVKITAEQTGSLDSFRATFNIEKDQIEYMSSDVTFTKMPLEGRFNLRSPIDDYETITAMFSHTGETLNFKNHAELNVAGDKSEIEMTFNIGRKLEGTVSASSPYFPNVGMKFDFAGNTEKSNTLVELTYGQDTYSLESDLDTKTQFGLNLKAQTPFKGYKTITAAVTNSARFPDINTFVQVKSDRRNMMTTNMIMSTQNGIDSKFSFQSVFTPTIQLSLTHSGIMTSFATNGEIRVNGEPNSFAVSFQSEPVITGSLSLETVFSMPITSSFSVTPEGSAQMIHVEGSMSGKTITSDFKYDLGNQKGLTASITSPFSGFEKIDFSANLRNFYKSMSGVIELEYPGYKSSFESKVNWRKGLTGSVTLKTPHSLLGMAKADFTLNTELPKMDTSLNVNILGKTYAVNGELDTSKVSGKLNVVTPFDGFENTAVSFTSEGTIDDLSVNGKLAFLGEEIVYTFTNTRTTGRLETKSQLTTPYTEDITFDMLLSGELSDFYHSISLAFGEENSATLATTSKISLTSVFIESTLATMLTGYSDEHKVKLNFNGQPSNFKASTMVKIFGSFYTAESDFSVEDGISAHLKIKTPIPSFDDIEVNFEHEGTYRRFSTKADVQYGTNKKIDGIVTFLKYGWRRLETNVEFNTPFVGFESTKAAYRHTSDSTGFECDASATVLNKDLTGTLRATVSPITASLNINTPFEGFENIGSNMKLVHGAGRISAQGNVVYMKDSEISINTEANINDSPKLGSIKITTPFTGFETTELTISQTGTLEDFRAMVTFDSDMTKRMHALAHFKYSSLVDIDGVITFTSQIENLERLQISFNTESLRKKYTSKVEMIWGPGKVISLDGSFTDNSVASSADITLRTPFQVISQVKVNTRMGLKRNVYINYLLVEYNNKAVVDFENTLDLSTRKSFTYTMNKPVPFTVKMEGKMSDKYDASLSFTPSTDRSNKYKLSGSFDPTPKKLSLKYNDDISFDGTMNEITVNAKGDKYGYEATYDSRTKYVKLILPQRNLVASMSQSAGITEGKFMWDADRDESKQIGFKSQLTPTADSVKTDITLNMPSLGKDVQIDSEMILSRGRVIFDGKTELTYSRDVTKKFTIFSKVQDLSSWSSKNYSFTFGISHPYTSVDMQLESEVGKSDSELTGRVGVKYMNIKRQTKEFSATGQVDKLKNSVSLNIDTPVKKISINGGAESSPYRLSMTNTYDNKRPINTIISVDPVKKSFDFQMNYDLDNPSSEFHMSAKYVNSSAVATEIYHVVNRQRVSDVLVTARLNNSHLLHSRIHWRPELLDDLKALSNRKSGSYKRQLNSFVEATSSALRGEMRRKLYLIKQHVVEEMEPLTIAAAEKLEKMFIMYETNQYHIKDITDSTIDVTLSAKAKFDVVKESTERYIGEVSSKIEDRMSTCLGNTKDNVEEMLVELEEAIEVLVLKGCEIYNSCIDQVLNMTRPYADSASSSYNNYVQYMSQMDTSPVTSMADKYTSTIYGARDYINSRVSSLMARDDVKYAKSVSGQILQHGKNAYKYWEIRENTEMVVKAVANWVREEIENEIADIKAKVLRFKKTALTVYDPAHGEIQVEVHLPIPVKYLDTIPVIAVDMSKMQNLISDIPSFSIPSWNESSWLPPYDATAFIKGNTIRTFDGLTYDLSTSCTFLMAKDYVDGNFSIVLHKDGDNKTVVVFADGKAIEIFSNGKVNVDKKPINMPAVFNYITMTSEEGTISINVADSLHVTFYPEIDTYIFTLNGFYFGKTNGVLGSYDNEPSNDVMTSFGKPIDNTDRFARTWEVGQARCQ